LPNSSAIDSSSALDSDQFGRLCSPNLRQLQLAENDKNDDLSVVAIILLSQRAIAFHIGIPQSLALSIYL